MLVKWVENKDVGVDGKSSNIINQVAGCPKIQKQIKNARRKNKERNLT